MAYKLNARKGATATVRLLGFVPRAGLEALTQALNGVAGPRVEVHGQGADRQQTGPGEVVALIQAEPRAALTGAGRAAMLGRLHTIQRRLEVACQMGPLLPADPAAACCPAAALGRLLDDAWPAVTAALAVHGRLHQWDIVLRWEPEPVLARHRAGIAQAASGLDRAGLADAVAGVLRVERGVREAALLAALAPAVLAFSPGGPAGGPNEVALTVLLPAAGEAAVEKALGNLDPAHAEGASLDMRGPLPPLSFAAVRVAETRSGDAAQAWRRLDLPERVEPGSLHRHWRQRAFVLHPDRHGGGGDFATAMTEATEAHHLLRDLMRGPAPDGGWSLDALTASMAGRPGHRLVVPAADTPHAVAASEQSAPALREAMPVRALQDAG